MHRSSLYKLSYIIYTTYENNTFTPLSFYSFLGCTSSLTAQYKWFNPQKESFPVVRGQAWQEDPAGFYTRLPQRAKDKVRKAVWDLSLQSAGLSIAFRSNLRK